MPGKYRAWVHEVNKLCKIAGRREMLSTFVDRGGTLEEVEATLIQLAEASAEPASSSLEGMPTPHMVQ